MTVPGLAAARVGDWARCLDELLAAWGTHRTIELADAIELAGKRAASKNIASATLRDRIATVTAAAITPLVEAIRAAPDMIDLAVELARTAPPDPRIAQLLRGCMGEDDLDLRLIDALATHDEPRSRTLLEQRATSWQQRRDQFPRRRAEIDHLLAVARHVWPTYPSPGYDLSLLTPLLHAEPAGELSALLDAVYADLDNDAPRLVYADALQDAGDPRGEMIALQLTDPGTARELELIRAHERRWLGRVHEAVQTSGRVWWRGFLTSVRVAEHAIDDTALADRSWLTVEELDMGQYHGARVARLVATLPVLRRVYRFGGNDLNVLPATLPWTHFGLRTFPLGPMPALPDLEELDLSALGPNELIESRLPALATIAPRVRIAIPAHHQPVIPSNPTVVIVPSFEFPPLANQTEIWLRGRAVELRNVDESLLYPIAILPRIRDRFDHITVRTTKPLDLTRLARIAPAVIE